MKKNSYHPESEPKPTTELDKTASPFAGICFVIFLFISIATTTYAMLINKLDLLPSKVSWSTFMNGEISTEIAKSLANAPVPDYAAKFERGFSWITSKDLGPRVREGKNSWLFLNDELVIHTNREANSISRIKEIVELKQELVTKGIELLVVLVPDKSRIESEYLGSQNRAKVLDSRLENFETLLSKNGVDVINLTAALIDIKRIGQDPYLRTDTHWNEQGAEISAQFVGEKIKLLKVQPSAAIVTSIMSQSDEFRPGDLVKLAGIDWLPLALQPLPEKARLSIFKSEPTHSKKISKVNDDLFGDENLPNIVLIGTSFSRTSQFIPYLEMLLHSKIGNFALDGGDYSGSAKAYFSSPSFKDTPPKLIIWEIPERVIEMDRSHDFKIMAN
jgi:alginate O-acetyltransferase complex protein AlgJ